MYVDTSILAKLYLREPESAAALSFVVERKERPACSELGRIELISTFHRKLRERQITAAELRLVYVQHDMDSAEQRIEWLPLTTATLERVQQAYRQLPATYFLRAGDAIHLATAAEAGLKEIYSNDRHLLAAAPVFKLKAINPLAR
jgi:predicted nucleic acid-binding protein